jgi:hypothetical protein
MPSFSKPRLILRRRLTPPPEIHTVVLDSATALVEAPLPFFPWPDGVSRLVKPILVNGKVVSFSVEAHFAEVPIMRCFRALAPPPWTSTWRRYQRISETEGVEVTPGPRPERVGQHVRFNDDWTVSVTGRIAEMIVSRQVTR